MDVPLEKSGTSFVGSFASSAQVPGAPWVHLDVGPAPGMVGSAPRREASLADLEDVYEQTKYNIIV